MQIYLSGGGSEEQTQLIDDVFFNNLKKRNIKTLIYIPLATKKEKIPGSIEWFNGAYKNRDVDIVVWDSLEGKNLEGMEDKVALYIGGGNTYLLMSLIIDSGLIYSFNKFIEKDGIVYGGSAGAIILGNEISIAPEDNVVGIEELKGFDLVNGLSIWPHYKEEHDSKILEYIKKEEINVLALPEDGGVFLDGKKITSIGIGNVYHFTPRKILISQ